jgi:hypothetical protein
VSVGIALADVPLVDIVTVAIALEGVQLVVATVGTALAVEQLVD